VFHELRTPEERRYKRCFHRVISGLERGGSLRFVTLTSSDQAINPIQQDFRRLIMRLRRRGIVKDYIRVVEIKNDGRQHIHMIFRGNYIAQAYLSYLWEKLHQSPIVDIRQVMLFSDTLGKAAAEMAKYMSKELHRRYSCSWGWVYKGFVKVWKQALAQVRTANAFYNAGWSFSSFLTLWKAHLRSHAPPQNLLDLLYLEMQILRRKFFRAHVISASKAS